MGTSKNNKSNSSNFKKGESGYGEKSIKVKKPLAQNKNTNSIKENEASAFINSGELDKAEEIYINLIKGKVKITSFTGILLQFCL